MTKRYRALCFFRFVFLPLFVFLICDLLHGGYPVKLEFNQYHFAFLYESRIWLGANNIAAISNRSDRLIIPLNMICHCQNLHLYITSSKVTTKKCYLICKVFSESAISLTDFVFMEPIVILLSENPLPSFSLSFKVMPK